MNLEEPSPLAQLVPNNHFPFYGCSPITNVTNGFVTYSTLELPPYKADTTATLSCHLGFLPTEKTVARCDPSGVWTELGSCVTATVQQCLPIAEVSNGQVKFIGSEYN